MKKQLTSWAAALFMVLSFNVSFGQGLSVENFLDKAVTLSQEAGNQSELANVLSLGSTALTKELTSGAGTNSNIGSKLLGQVGVLNGLIPMASQGNLKAGVLAKVVNTIKLLLAANRINGLLGGGKSALLKNGAGLLSNLGLLKASGSLLGGAGEKTLGTLVNAATKSIGKFGKKGFLGIGGEKAGVKAATGQLTKIVDLISNASL